MRFTLTYIFLLLNMLICASTFKVPKADNLCNKKVIGYITSWGEGQLAEEQFAKVTHIIFAFFEITSKGYIVLPTSHKDLAIQKLKYLKKMKSKYPHLVTLFAVGGWENSQYLSYIAAMINRDNSGSFAKPFLASILDILDDWGFDGVDIDWEYPVAGGAVKGLTTDKTNYVHLLTKIRAILSKHQREQKKKKKTRLQDYILTIAGAGGFENIERGFDLKKILKLVDWINVMTYDYYGPWASEWGAFTGPPAPLFFAAPPNYSRKNNVNWAINYYLYQTDDPSQIVMGVPFYGRYWKNVLEEEGLFRKAERSDGAKPFEGGYVPWNKISSKWSKLPLFEWFYDSKAEVPYAYNSVRHIYLGHENPQSIKAKVDYALKKNLGGIMIWALDYDDESNSMLKAAQFTDADCTKQNTKIRYLDKIWWAWKDGPKLAGRCGLTAPLINDTVPICNPNAVLGHCCSARGRCGTGVMFCLCSKCVNFKKKPHFRYNVKMSLHYGKAEKTLGKDYIPNKSWYDWGDGVRFAGRCGLRAPKLADGSVPGCNPDSVGYHCCGEVGWCGSGADFCLCANCKDYRRTKEEIEAQNNKTKHWFTLEDGFELFGRCGKTARRINGRVPICDPRSPAYHCCSQWGFCGSGADYCNCNECMDYRRLKDLY